MRDIFAWFSIFITIFVYFHVFWQYAFDLEKMIKSFNAMNVTKDNSCTNAAHWHATNWFSTWQYWRFCVPFILREIRNIHWVLIIEYYNNYENICYSKMPKVLTSCGILHMISWYSSQIIVIVQTLSYISLKSMYKIFI